MEQLSAWLLAFTSVLSSFLVIYKTMRSFYKEVRNDKTIIGVVGKVPNMLLQYKDFTSYRKARLAEDKVVILHCRTLSYALRHCDFVSATTGNDEKIRDPDSDFWLTFEKN